MKNKKNIITPKNILLVGMAIALIYLITCNKKPYPNLNPVIPVAIQKEAVRVDSVASKHYNDSVSLKQKQASKEAEMWYNEWKASETRYNDLEKGISEFNEQPVPDSCKELQTNYIAQLAKLSKENKAKDAACQNTISLKNTAFAQQELIVNNKTAEIKKLRSFLDTAFVQQTKQAKIIKQLKPKNSIYIGATALGYESKIINGYGINLGLRNKKGTMYEVGALQIGSTINYTIGFKKTLFKF